MEISTRQSLVIKIYWIEKKKQNRNQTVGRPTDSKTIFKDSMKKKNKIEIENRIRAATKEQNKEEEKKSHTANSSLHACRWRYTWDNRMNLKQEEEEEELTERKKEKKISIGVYVMIWKTFISLCLC